MYRNLEAELKRKGMTKGALAREMGLTPSTVSLKLNGKSPISLKEANTIKRILKVELPLEELFQNIT